MDRFVGVSYMIGVARAVDVGASRLVVGGRCLGPLLQSLTIFLMCYGLVIVLELFRLAHIASSHPGVLLPALFVGTDFVLLLRPHLVLVQLPRLH